MRINEVIILINNVPVLLEEGNKGTTEHRSSPNTIVLMDPKLVDVDAGSDWPQFQYFQ